MSFLKMLVLTLNSSQLLIYSRLKLRFFFLNANFSKYFRAEWVKKHSREMSFCSVNTDDSLSRSSRPTLLKKRLCRRYFPVNFTKFLRTSFLQNTSSGFFWLKILLSTHRAIGRHSEGTWALREHQDTRRALEGHLGT